MLRREERDQCKKMHALLKDHNLTDGSIRWLTAQKDRVKNGELYREIADSHGHSLPLSIQNLPQEQMNHFQ